MVSITYPSEGRNLGAWFHLPGAPVLVYLHGGFSGDATEAYACPQFAQAGYSVLVPTYRGENGNPGDFELLFGEVRDAAAAVRHVRTLEGVDADRIGVFGHSAGAAVAALLAGMDDVPARMTGGAGGFYDPYLVESFLLEFDVAEPVASEVMLRTPSMMVGSMRTRHHAFVGDKDDAAALGGTLGWLKSKGAADHPLRVYDVAGDHFESFAPACAAFFELAEGRAPTVAPRNVETLDAAGRDAGLQLFHGKPIWGEGPFGEPAPQARAPQMELRRIGGWEIAIPAGAVVKTSEVGGLTTLAFKTDAVQGEFAVGSFSSEVLGTVRPMNVMFNVLRGFEPTAARFFFPELESTGLEVRGQKNGRRVYARMGLFGEQFVSLEVWPPEAAEVHAVVRSMRAVGQ